MLIELFIAEQLCHKLNMNAMDKIPLNSTLKVARTGMSDIFETDGLSLNKLPKEIDA